MSNNFKLQSEFQPAGDPVVDKAEVKYWRILQKSQLYALPGKSTLIYRYEK